MSTAKVLKRPSRPNHGPLFSSFWSPTRKKWVCKMNDQGQEAFDKILSDFGGQPIKILAAKFRSLLADSNYGGRRELCHQAALIGLMNAVRCWKPDGGAGLSTVAMFHVAQQVQLALSDDRRRSVSVQPLPLETVDADGTTVIDLLAAGDRVKRSTVEDDAEFGETQDRLSALWKHLTPNERLAIEAVHVRGLTLRAAGEEMGVTRERVRQLCQSGLRRMRKHAGVFDPDSDSKSISVRGMRANGAAGDERLTVGRNLREIRMNSIRDALRDHPQGLTVPQVANIVHLSDFAVRNVLRYGMGRETPVFRCTGGGKRFSASPARWFLADQPTATRG